MWSLGTQTQNKIAQKSTTMTSIYLEPLDISQEGFCDESNIHPRKSSWPQGSRRGWHPSAAIGNFLFNILILH